LQGKKAQGARGMSGSGRAADAAIWFDLARRACATDFLGYDTKMQEGQ